jgi:hypothetical protein
MLDRKVLGMGNGGEVKFAVPLDQFRSVDGKLSGYARIDFNTQLASTVYNKVLPLPRTNLHQEKQSRVYELKENSIPLKRGSTQQPICFIEPQNTEQGIMNVEVLKTRLKLLTSTFLVRYSKFNLSLNLGPLTLNPEPLFN